MVMKRWIAGLGGALLLGTAGLGGLAAAADTPATTQSETAQRSDRAGVRDKWDSLTDAQKHEVYALMEKELADRETLLNQYASLGLIDQERADAIKHHLQHRLTELKESGECPFPSRPQPRDSKASRTTKAAD